MNLIELFINFFLKQSQKAFDPAEIGRQILLQIKKILQSLIILLVGSVIFCMLIGHLIARTLDLLDKGEFYFSNSVILLLVLTLIDLAVIIYVLKKTMKEAPEEAPKQDQSSSGNTISPIEGAVAALIIDFIKQREVSRKADLESKEV